MSKFMDKLENGTINVLEVLLIIFIFAIIALGIFFVTPTGRGVINTYFHEVQKVDDQTRYSTKKEVEDSCRAMLSSYESDRLTYEQYKDSDSEEKVGWAEQAKMRANKTASTYNNYILKNKFVWNDNIPEDIYMVLETID